MGIEIPTRPYAFERIFELTSADAARHPHDLLLQVLALEAEIARHRETSGSALAEARSEGFAAGLAHARSDTGAALLQAEHALITAIAKLEAGFVATETRIAAVAAEVAMAAAELLAARAVAVDPCLAIDEAIGRVLTQVGFRETLHIHVHPALVEALDMLNQNRVAVEQRALSIVVHAEPALPPGDAHILWDAGGLSLDAAARRAAVRHALGLDALIA